jgi:hypothetical protein
LLHVINPRLRARTLPDFDWRYLHRTARNLAAAVDAVHARGYVIGDVHDGNVLVTPGALVTLIDVDSFQVRTDDGGLYPCPVGRAEYTPPELQGRSFSRVERAVEHDRFGLAVLFFQLLMEGSHPFRAQWLGSGEPLPLEERIRRGCFPYVDRPPCPVAPPGNAPTLAVLHPPVADLFRRCFADGHDAPGARPTAAEWHGALVEAEEGLVLCPQGHYRAAHLGTCPRCELEREREQIRAQASPAPAQPVTYFRPVSARAPTSPIPMRRYPRWPAVALVLLVALAVLLGRALWSMRPDAATPTPAMIPTPLARASLQGASVGSAGDYPVERLSLANLAQIDRLEQELTLPGSDPVVWLSEDELLTGVTFMADGQEIAAGRRVVFSPDQTMFASWWQGSAVGIWQVLDESPAGSIPWAEPVSALALSSPDGGEGMLLVVGSADGSMRLWRWEDRAYTLLHTIEGNAFDVTAMAFSHDGTLLAVGSEDTKVRLWRVSDCVGATGDGKGCAALLCTLEGHGDRVRRIVFAPGDGLLASAAGESTVYLWDASDGAVYHALAHRAPVNDVAFSPDGALLASGGADGMIALWDVLDGELALDIDLERADRVGVQSLAFSPDGVALAYKMADGRLSLLGLRPESVQGPPSGGMDAVVVMDSSGDLSVAHPVKEAVRGLVQRLHFGSLCVGFVSYSSRAEVRETSYRSVVQAIEQTRPGSGTNTADGIRAGTGLLTQGVGPGSLLAGGKVMLLMSSGRADQVVDSACYAQDLYRPNDGTSLENVARDCAMYYADQARLNRMIIHTIALGEGADHELLQAIADRTGGQYRYAAQPGDLQAVLDDVADLVFERVEQTQ